MKDSELSKEDMLWFGSVRVGLHSSPGKVFSASDGSNNDRRPVLDVVSRDNLTSATAVRKRMYPLSDEQSNGSDIVTPAMPCLDVEVVDHESAGNIKSLPESLLQEPLLKCPMTLGIPNAVAVASGGRSCLLRCVGKEKQSTRWYRLKGAGDFERGFWVRENQSKLKRAAWRDIRGCAFVHTALRELFVCRELENAMAKDGRVAAGNRAVGWATYAPPNAPLGIENIDLVPTCVIMETVGDRRLGTHALGGVVTILPALLRKSLSVYEKELRSLFPSGRRDPLGAPPATTQEIVSNFMIESTIAMSTGEDPPEEGKESFANVRPKDAAILAKAEAAAFKCAHAEINLPAQITRDGEKPMPAEPWGQMWHETLQRLSTSASNIETHGSVLVYMFARLGWDVGLTIARMHAAGYSWGTYSDNMCHEGQLHCNAHANNLVVCKPHFESDGVTMRDAPVVAFVDLDMAFSQKDAVDADAALGQKDDGVALPAVPKETFDRLLRSEALNMLESLIPGSDASTGVPTFVTTDLEDEPASTRLAMSLLTDTMVSTFRGAWKGDDTERPTFDPVLHAAMYDIMRLGIIVMADYVA